MRVQQIMLIVLSGLALAGCPKKPQTLPDTSQAPESVGATTEGTTQGDVETGGLGADQAALEEAKRAGTVVYFDYDRAEIKSEYVPIVTAHAKFLNGGGARKVRTLYGNRVVAGFAGTAADAFTLFSRFEGKLEEHRGNLAPRRVVADRYLACHRRALDLCQP